MIHYSVLGSGSSGNSYLFSYEQAAVLFDAGFSLRELRRRTQEASLDFDQIQGLCITHLHPDHCRGAGVFARQTGKPVYVHRQLVEQNPLELEKLGIPASLMRTFTTEQPFQIGNFRITAFPTSHDSPYSVGFSLDIAQRRFTLLTDTGMIDDTMRMHASCAHVLFLEANYDVPMLDKGPYPYLLKRRIRGERGHLSNTDAIELLNSCPSEHGRQVYFCHLSKTNNRPDLLESTCCTHLKWTGVTTICQHGNSYYGSLDPGEPIK